VSTDSSKAHRNASALKFYYVAEHVWVDLKLKPRPVAQDASKSYETQGSRTRAYSQDKFG